MDPFCCTVIVAVVVLAGAYMFEHNMLLMRRILSDVVRLLYGGVTGEAPVLFSPRTRNTRRPDG